MTKYRSVPTVVDGIRFPSKLEAHCYQVLRTLEKGGAIRNLKLQVPFDLRVNGVKVCRYVADFTYDERKGDAWVPVVAEAKGFKTAAYRLKAKLMQALHGIQILEFTSGTKVAGPNLVRIKLAAKAVG